MKKLKFSKLLRVFVGAVLILSLFAACKKDHNPTPTPVDNTITGIVSSNASFSLLKSAVVKAGLASTLSGTGPFTVFAPSDTAFAGSGITAATIAALSGDQLKTILLYHTIPAKILAADVPAGPNAKVITAGGDSVFVTKNVHGVFVNGIPVTQADIMASNGVIHAIARVLMPPVGNLVQAAQADTSLTYLVAAVVRASSGSADLVSIISTGGIFTIFAPTNDAFRAAGFPTIDAINAADPDQLATILTYHAISGRIFSSDLSEGEQATTVNGESVTISLDGGAAVKGSSNSTKSNITATNIVASNGVIHKIDQVLLP
jgi:uncharacterized surface protein with fasciclin (FAS1) repeats